MTQQTINPKTLQKARYNITIERIQLLLTADGWSKPDLAYQLKITYGYLDWLLSLECRSVPPKIAREVKRLRTQQEWFFGKPGRNHMFRRYY